LKLVQERAGSRLEVIGIVNDFGTWMAQQLRERIDKWDYMKLKLLHNKRTGFKIEEIFHRIGENLCHLYIRLITRIYLNFWL
jgi:hypothetical protein